MTPDRPWPELAGTGRTTIPPLVGLLRASAPWAPWAVATLAALRLLEAWTIAAAGLALAGSGPVGALLLAACGVALRGLQGVVRSLLVQAIRGAFLRLSAERVCSASALSTSETDAPQLELRLFRGLYAATDIVTDLAPAAVAHTLAIVTLAPFLATRMPVAWLATASGAGLLAVGAHVGAGYVYQRHLDHTLIHERRLARDIGFLLEGHIEIVASGHAGVHAQSVATRATLWTNASRSTEAWASIGGRLPTLILAGVAAIGWLALGREDTTTWSGAGRVVVLASIFPSIAGLAGAAVKARSLRTDLAEFFGLLGAPPDPGRLEAPEETGPSEPGADIVADAVSFSYGDTAVLRGLSFRWSAGETLAIAGANGSGKSTLLRLLLRLADPTSGALSVGGVPLDRLPAAPWRRGIGFAPQRAYLPPDGTIRNAIGVLATEATDEAMREALAKVGLTAKLRARWGDELVAPVAALSSGERQRLCLARVLATGRRILLLDEPDANLDADGRTQLIALLRELKATHRILLVAHDAAVLAVADRLLHLAPHSAGAPSPATP